MKTPRAVTTGMLLWIAQAAAMIVYLRRLRPLFLRWGATDEEMVRDLPGDEIVTSSGPSTTNAITIDAPPSLVWPWLVQMGPGRAGAYTYDWVENLFKLNMHSADRIVPEWQHMEVGDTFPMGPNGPSLGVVSIEPERSLVLAYPDGTWSWSFLLEPVEGERTRLITRNRMPVHRPADRIRLELMLPGAFLMMRKMLLGIRERAERLAREQARSPEKLDPRPSAA
jgi:hypothetical protein